MGDLKFMSGDPFLQMSNFPSAKIKLDQLFNEWIKMEGSATICTLLLDSLSLGSQESSYKIGNSSSQGPPRAVSIKKSPKKRTQSEMLSNLKSSSITSTSNDISRLSLNSDSEEQTPEENNALRRRSNFDKIPVFYTPGEKSIHLGYVNDDDKLVNRLTEIESFFKPFPQGIPVEKFVHVTKRLCGIPSFFNLPMCKRINEQYGDPDSEIPPPRTVGRSGRQPSGVTIKLKAFLKFWQAEVEPFDRVERFYRIIKKHDAKYILKDDFVPFLQELLHFHPGLDFLEAHEEFQRKYALTVITRIFYKVNTSRTGKISLREVRNSKLFAACMHVDEETDINRVVDYFSYEHFYVLYCKFFELDTDKDSKLTRNDLLKYCEHSLSEAIVDRIFQVGTKVFTDGQVGGFNTSGMGYPDFIFFMLSEEDKSTDCALKYWFNCCDLDGDNRLSPEEMKYFYRQQIHRVTSLGQESINFQDVLCQMIDMISPCDQFAITLEDMTKPDKRMISGVLFDILFNLHKFMRFEMRDPFQEKLRRDDAFQSDWDRYAHVEYNRLAQEEESGYSMSDDQIDMDVIGGERCYPDMLDDSDAQGDADRKYQHTMNGWSLRDGEDDDENANYVYDSR